MGELTGSTRNNRGQFAIEGILLLSILVGAFLFVTKQIRERKLVSNLVKGPIKQVATMSGYGTRKADGCVAAGKSNKETLGKCHPNSVSRSLSSDPGL